VSINIGARRESSLKNSNEGLNTVKNGFIVGRWGMAKKKPINKTASAKKSIKKTTSVEKVATLQLKQKSVSAVGKKVVRTGTKKDSSKSSVIKKVTPKKKVIPNKTNSKATASSKKTKSTKRASIRKPTKSVAQSKRLSKPKINISSTSKPSASKSRVKSTPQNQRISKSSSTSVPVTEGDENLPMVVPDYMTFKKQSLDLPDLNDLLSSDDSYMTTESESKTDIQDTLLDTSGEDMEVLDDAMLSESERVSVNSVDAPSAQKSASIDVPPDPAAAFPQKKEKTGFFSRLFGHKKKEQVADSPQLEDTTLSGFKEDATDFKDSELHPHEREKIYLENTKRRIDNDYRERIQHVQKHETILGEKHEELEARESDLLQREAEIASKEEQFAEIQRLQEEVEDQKISIEYQKQQIEELKSELALKDNELKEREIELDAREKALEQLEATKSQEKLYEHENQELHQKIEKEDETIEYLQKEIEKQRKSFEEQMATLQINSHVPSIVDELHQLITECYVDLAHHNIEGVKLKYNTIRDRYMSEAKEFDTAGELYKDVHTLYEDIKNSIGK